MAIIVGIVAQGKKHSQAFKKGQNVGIIGSCGVKNRKN